MAYRKEGLKLVLWWSYVRADYMKEQSHKLLQMKLERGGREIGKKNQNSLASSNQAREDKSWFFFPFIIFSSTK